MGKGHARYIPLPEKTPRRRLWGCPCRVEGIAGFCREGGQGGLFTIMYYITV
jgi:hypothetical protein